MDSFKNPWEESPHIWPTKASFFAFLRGNLRRAVWEKWPPKFEFKNEVCAPPPEGYKGRSRSGAYCALTGEWVGKSAAEVDHIKGNVSLQDWEDVLPFIKHLCASKDNLQYVSKEGHKIKSLAERKNLSFNDAMIEKKAISIIKSKGDKKWLEDRGVEPASNQKLRRQQIVDYLKENGVGS